MEALSHPLDSFNKTTQVPAFFANGRQPDAKTQFEYLSGVCIGQTAEIDPKTYNLIKRPGSNPGNSAFPPDTNLNPEFGVFPVMTYGLRGTEKTFTLCADMKDIDATVARMKKDLETNYPALYREAEIRLTRTADAVFAALPRAQQETPLRTAMQERVNEKLRVLSVQEHDWPLAWAEALDHAAKALRDPEQTKGFKFD